jgi:hypothetical protein
MNKPAITKHDVYIVAKEFAKIGKIPTIREVREKLGNRGSEGTILKYLNAWKIEILDIACESNFCINPAHDPTQKNLKSAKDNNEIKILSNSLVSAETENALLKDSVSALDQNLNEITNKYKELCLKCDKVESVLKEVKQERDTAIQAIIDDKNRKIESLQQELLEANKDSLEKIKNMGYSSDDALIREKVKIISLEDKIKQLLEKTVKLGELLDKERQVNQPLRNELEKQRQFIQKVVSWEQLQDYEKSVNKDQDIA